MIKINNFCFFHEFIIFLNTFKHGDTLEWFKNKTKWFDSFYRIIFIFIVIIVNIVFLIHTTNFLFGNHDFDYVRNGVAISMWNGRYTNALPLKICGGYLSPVLNNLLSFFAMAVSSMLMCAYYNLPKKKHYWLSACLLPMLLPYVMTWFYYSYETFSHTMLPGLAVGALWLVRDKMNIERYIISVGLIWFVLGIYPSVLSIFALLICGQLIIDILNNDKLMILYRNIRFFVILISGCILFKITLFILRITGKMSQSLYNLSMPSCFELIKKIIPEIMMGFKQFIHETPYIPVSLKLLIFLIIFISIILTFIYAFKISFESILQRCFCIIFLVVVWCGMFFACMIPDFLSKDDFAFVIRTAYFGVPFLALISLILIYQFGNKIIINICFMISIIILWCSVVSDFEIQKNWKIGFQNEVLAYSRVLSMIEQNPQVSNLKSPINYFQIGSLPSGRRAFCRPQITDGIDSLELHSFVFNPDWSPRAGGIFDYLGANFKWEYRGSFRVDLEEISKKLDLTSPVFLDFLKYAKAYPAPPEQCLFVDYKSNSLVVVLDKDVLNDLKKSCDVK